MGNVRTESKVIVEVETEFGIIKCVQTFEHQKLMSSSHYDVFVDDELKHPKCTANDAMRALGFYMASLCKDY